MASEASPTVRRPSDRPSVGERSEPRRPPSAVRPTDFTSVGERSEPRRPTVGLSVRPTSVRPLVRSTVRPYALVRDCVASMISIALGFVWVSFRAIRFQNMISKSFPRATSEGFSLSALTARVEMSDPRVDRRASPSRVFRSNAHAKSSPSRVFHRAKNRQANRGPSADQPRTNRGIESPEQRPRTVHFANADVVQKPFPNANRLNSGAARPRGDRPRTRLSRTAASAACRAAVRLNFIWVGAWSARL